MNSSFKILAAFALALCVIFTVLVSFFPYSYDIFSNCPYSVILNHIDSRYIATMSSRYFPGMVFLRVFYTCCAFFFNPIHHY